jgi:filamentous hemagglutinin family protein
MNTKYLFSSLTAISIVSFSPNTHAQTYQPSNRIPIADNSLGTQVSGANNNFTITGGVNLGQNLLHSFTDFSVPTGGAATFDNLLGKQSIITRVTGGNFSDINGLVNTQGANFFLLNPNGIVFGTNAQLNVGQTFVGSTANGIDLVDGGGNTVNFLTNQSKDAQLLTINPNALFNVSSLNIGGGNGQISNFGTLQTVNPNQYIGLIGGNVNLNGGKIEAPGGRVELGGLSDPGTVTLGIDGNNLRAQVSMNVARADVSLTNQARVNIAGAGGGNIAIEARNVEILESSAVGSGIGGGLGTPATVAGDIKINATGDVKLSGTGGIGNIVNAKAVGQGGNIEIAAQNLTVTNGAGLVASTNGQGDAGNIKITVTDNISFSGGQDNTRSAVFSTVEQDAVGKGGKIEIVAQNLSFTNGAGLTASTRGRGDAGNIKITATGNISFDGIKDGFNSAASSTVEQGAVGKGGEIEITAQNLTVTNGAGLSTSTLGQGDAGNIKITAASNASFNNARSAVLSTIEQNAVGKGGKIEITAQNLTVTNGAQLVASTRGQGDAGNVKITATGNISFDNAGSGAFSTVEQNAIGQGGRIEITTKNLTVTNGASTSASTSGRGDAGDIKITATGNVSFDGIKDGFSSAASSTVEQGAAGKGGEIEITTKNLTFSNEAQLVTSTRGRGDAGNIKITATGNVSFNNADSAAFSTVEQGAVGKGGEIEIMAQNLTVTNGAALVVSTRGQGDAGNINITVTDNISFSGGQDNTRSAAFSTVERGAVGKGGEIKIASQNFTVTNGARLIASTRGQGDAGNINITATENVSFNGIKDSFVSGLFVNSESLMSNAGDIIVISPKIMLDDGSTINSTSISTNGGNIQIGGRLPAQSTFIQGRQINSAETKLLSLRRGSQISTNASGTNQQGSNGGNITISAPNGFIVTAPNENSDISANGFSGSGGKVNIDTRQNFWISPLSRAEVEKRLGTTEPSGLNPAFLSTNDITAISQVNPNLSGQVSITPPQIDITAGLSSLPNSVTDPTNQINPNCSAKAIANNSFTSVGRGGIPATPKDPLNEQEIATNWVRLNPQDTRPLPPLAATPAPATQIYTSAEGKPIVEAQAWRRERNGDIVLVATASGNLSRPPQPQAGCVDR